MQIFYIFLAESFVSSEKLHTFAAQKGHIPRLLGYGVMVTLQILVLPFLVRVRVAQHSKEHHQRDALFLLSSIIKNEAT